MADVKVRGSRRRCQASDDVYAEQIEHERKETDEFLRSPMSPLLLAGTITFEHHGVACESATACGNSLPVRVTFGDFIRLRAKPRCAA